MFLHWIVSILFCHTTVYRNTLSHCFDFALLRWHDINNTYSIYGSIPGWFLCSRFIFVMTPRLLLPLILFFPHHLLPLLPSEFFLPSPIIELYYVALLNSCILHSPTPPPRTHSLQPLFLLSPVLSCVGPVSGFSRSSIMYGLKRGTYVRAYIRVFSLLNYRHMYNSFIISQA